MITTVAACKAFRMIPTESKEHDVELERLVKVVQQFLEQTCGRIFADSGSQNPLVEYFSGCEYRHQLVVARPPIISVTDIQIDNDRLWDKPILPASQWAIYDADAGIIKLLSGYSFSEGVMNIRLRYRGGYAKTPPDLEQAAIEMVWANRSKGEQNLIGVRSRALTDGSVQYVNMDWPMNLAPILDKYALRPYTL